MEQKKKRGRPKGVKNSVKGGSVVDALNKSSDTIPEIVDTSTVQQQLTEIKDKVKEKKILDSGEQEKKETPYQRKKRLEQETTDKGLESIRGGMSLATDLLLDVICVRLPNPLPATETEKRIFNQATEAMFDKYLPMILPYAVEVGFGVALATVIVPRMIKEKKDDTPEQKNNLDIRQNGNGEKQIVETTSPIV